MLLYIMRIANTLVGVKIIYVDNKNQKNHYRVSISA